MHFIVAPRTRHAGFENILGGVPPTKQGASKDLKAAVYSLLKIRYLIWCNKSKEAIQLNKGKLKEIKGHLIG